MTAHPRQQAQSKQPKKPKSTPSRPSWIGLKKSDLANLAQKIKDKFKWSHEPRKFQQDAIEAQLLRRDVFIHAGTGMGKTAVAAGPHAHEATKGMVTFMVSPLIALQEEQVVTFRKEFGLEAIAVNSSHGGVKKDVMEDICDGKWQIVIVSPEILLSKRFVKGVLKRPGMGPQILSVVVDEAHVISHWGSEFRKKYAELGVLRALLPKGTPIVAMSATLPARVRDDVLKKLQFGDNHVSLNVGNDRPNVSIVVRAIQNTMNTYSDLDFLIPAGVKEPKEVPKTMVYADQVSAGVDIEDHLYDLAPEAFQGTGFVRPYNATLSQEYRDNVMALFRAGVVRILICTDAAGMGCNVPDVDIVVQWKLPSTVSSFVQRAGRAARGQGRTGLAVLLVEKAVYEADLSDLTKAVSKEQGNAIVKAKGKKQGVRKSSEYPKANKQYAIAHGVWRGGFNPQFDEDELAKDVPIDKGSIDEGLYSLAQSTTCRRMVLKDIYGNETPHPTVPCCDICCPDLLNRTRPARSEPIKRAAAVKLGVPNEEVVEALHEWRKGICEADFGDAVFGPSVILKDEKLEALASVGPILSLKELERVVGEDWPWFGRYGDRLLTKLKSLAIPPMIPKPAQPRKTKRAQQDAPDGGGRQKKQRTDIREGSSSHSRTSSTAVSTAVNHPSSSSPAAAASHTHWSSSPSYFQPHLGTPGHCHPNTGWMTPLPYTYYQQQGPYHHPYPSYSGYSHPPSTPSQPSQSSSLQFRHYPGPQPGPSQGN